MLSQKYVIRLLQRLIFAIEWHDCASNTLLLLIKRLLLGDALATIIYPFCRDKNLVLSESQHPSQDLHLILVFIVQINDTDWNAVFKIKITIVRKYNSIMAICRRSWSLFPLNIVAVLPHSVAPLPHSVAPLRHFALYPHTLTHHTRTFRRTIPTTSCRTTSAHSDAPNPHTSSHRTTWYSCKTGFSYETRFSCKSGYSL